MKTEKNYPQNDCKQVAKPALAEFIQKLSRLLDENSEITMRTALKVSLIKRSKKDEELGRNIESENDINSAMDELWALADRFENQIRTASDTLELLDEIV